MNKIPSLVVSVLGLALAGCNRSDVRPVEAATSSDADAEQAESFDDGNKLRDNNTPESVLASKQIAATVNAAMDVLPIELRTAIVLREIEGLSYEEIS